jgi:galactonate dehydratase
VNVPICTGEHLYTRHGFRELLERQSVDIIMPDIVRTGGISESRKIAAMAETYYIPFAPHNPNSPVSSLVSLHTCIGVPNFLILEFFALDVPWRDEIIEPALHIENGYLIPPAGPGMGAKLNVDVVNKHLARAT